MKTSKIFLVAFSIACALFCGINAVIGAVVVIGSLTSREIGVTYVLWTLSFLACTTGFVANLLFSIDFLKRHFNKKSEAEILGDLAHDLAIIAQFKMDNLWKCGDHCSCGDKKEGSDEVVGSAVRKKGKK